MKLTLSSSSSSSSSFCCRFFLPGNNPNGNNNGNNNNNMNDDRGTSPRRSDTVDIQHFDSVDSFNSDFERDVDERSPRLRHREATSKAARAAASRSNSFNSTPKRASNSMILEEMDGGYSVDSVDSVDSFNVCLVLFISNVSNLCFLSCCLFWFL